MAITCRSRRTVHQGVVITLETRHLEFSNGCAHDVDVVLHHGAAAVVPIDADGHVWLVRQQRWAIEQATLELPAGRRDAGESLEQCARRELEEEIGMRADGLTDLGAIHTTPGFCNEVIGLYLAEHLSAGTQSLDENEELDIVRLPFSEAVQMAADGRMTDGKTVVGLLRAAARRGHTVSH